VGDWSAPQRLSQGALRQLALLEDFPSNVINFRIILPEIVQPSGVGNPPPQISLRDPVSITVIPAECQPGGMIPAGLCDAFTF
jgi:hypothetical protein